MDSLSGAEGAVMAKMPHKKLFKCSDETNFIELNKVRYQVYQNLAAIPSSLNGGNGHLGDGMHDAQYVARTGTAYLAIDVDPGPYDATILGNPGRVTQSRLMREEISSKIGSWRVRDLLVGRWFKLAVGRNHNGLTAIKRIKRTG